MFRQPPIRLPRGVSRREFRNVTRKMLYLAKSMTLLADRHQIGLPLDFSGGFVVAIYVAVSCRPAGVKPTETTG